MKLSIAALGAKGIPHPGGIELVMEEIGARLVERGHRFDIFVREHYMRNKPFKSFRGIGLPRSAGLHQKHSMRLHIAHQHCFQYFLSSMTWFT